MKFFSGFSLQNESELFSKYLIDTDFTVCGFSKGAQEALTNAVESKTRVDLLQLFSPAFFSYDQVFKEKQLTMYEKNASVYTKRFLKNVLYPKSLDVTPYLRETTKEELRVLLYFDWSVIRELKGVRIEVYIGAEDKIINVKGAVEFFKEYGEVYFIKGCGHLL